MEDGKEFVDPSVHIAVSSSSSVPTIAEAMLEQLLNAPLLMLLTLGSFTEDRLLQLENALSPTLVIRERLADVSPLL